MGKISRGVKRTEKSGETCRVFERSDGGKKGGSSLEEEEEEKEDYHTKRSIKV